MAVLIKGMDMPTNCLECAFYRRKDTVYDYCCISSAIPKGYVPDDCPLVPVPPHGRLGDLDRLEQMFVDIDNAPYSGFDGMEPFYSAEDAAQIIRLAPTVIQAEEDETWF